MEEVSFSDIRKASKESLQYQPLARKARLAFIQCNEMDDEWGIEAALRLQEKSMYVVFHLH